MTIEVLRLGHRPQRDKRITTHVCLTARALGAQKAHIAEEDAHVVESVTDLARRFGGSFEVDHGTGWKTPIKEWKSAGGQVVHLTMYGERLQDAIPAIKAGPEDVMIVVGAEKVPAGIYDLADHNVAVGNQPHSEVAALALLMDRLRDGAWESDTFEGAAVEVRPSARGKDVKVHEDTATDS